MPNLGKSFFNHSAFARLWNLCSQPQTFKLDNYGVPRHTQIQKRILFLSQSPS